MIATAFPGLFTFHEYKVMGVRQRAYWLRQAEAVRRQGIATMAHAVGIGMAGGEERLKAIDDLELSKTSEENMEMRSKAVWDMLFLMGGGKGV